MTAPDTAPPFRIKGTVASTVSTTPPPVFAETKERVETPPDPREQFAVDVYSGLRQISGGVAQLTGGLAKIMAAWVVYHGLKVGQNA